MQAEGWSSRTKVSVYPPSIAITADTSLTSTSARSVSISSNDLDDGVEGRAHWSRYACTSGFLIISTCPILLARSIGFRPLDAYPTATSGFHSAEPVDLHRNDESIRVCLHADETLVCRA